MIGNSHEMLFILNVLINPFLIKLFQYKGGIILLCYTILTDQINLINKSKTNHTTKV